MPKDMTDRPRPADCATMTEVRQGVDAIDRMLVVLISERQGYMDAAARIKKACSEPVSGSTTEIGDLIAERL